MEWYLIQRDQTVIWRITPKKSPSRFFAVLICPLRIARVRGARKIEHYSPCSSSSATGVKKARRADKVSSLIVSIVLIFFFLPFSSSSVASWKSEKRMHANISVLPGKWMALSVCFHLSRPLNFDVFLRLFPYHARTHTHTLPHTHILNLPRSPVYLGPTQHFHLLL